MISQDMKYFWNATIKLPTCFAYSFDIFKSAVNELCRFAVLVDDENLFANASGKYKWLCDVVSKLFQFSSKRHDVISSFRWWIKHWKFSELAKFDYQYVSRALVVYLNQLMRVLQYKQLRRNCRADRANFFFEIRKFRPKTKSSEFR